MARQSTFDDRDIYVATFSSIHPCGRYIHLGVNFKQLLLGVDADVSVFLGKGDDTLVPQTISLLDRDILCRAMIILRRVGKRTG